MPEELFRDLRHAARLLLRNPGFACVAAISLALGVGANAAIFQLLDAVRLRTLPVARPQELVKIRIVTPEWTPAIFRGPYPEMTNPLWEQIRDHQMLARDSALSHVAAIGSYPANLTQGGETRYVEAILVSGDFFATVDVGPMIGRVFGPSDDRPGCGSAGAVISHSFWQREFGGDRGVLGKTLMVNDHPYEIIGVTPPSFYGVEVGRPYDLAVPLCAQGVGSPEANVLLRRELWWLSVIGRLKPGRSIEQASGQLAAISPGAFKATAPSGYTAVRIDKYLKLTLGALPLDHGFSRLRDRYERPLWVLLAVAGVVLLIACANLANLMLARATAREREIAIRLAIGASRARLIRQLLAESALLAVIGTLLGWLTAFALSRFLLSFFNSFGANGNVYALDLHPDWRMFAFTGGVGVLTCLLFGLAPALRGTRVAPSQALAGGRSLTSGRGRFSLRRALVVVQVALSFALIVGAFLFARSLGNLLTIQPGFRQEGLRVAVLDFARLNMRRAQRYAFNRDVLEHMQRLPGVTAVAETSLIPISGAYWRMEVSANSETPHLSKFAWVSPEFFETMEIPFLSGRNFDLRDTEAAPRVAVVNESFAALFFAGADPIGKTFRSVGEPNYPEAVYRVIGVVRNSRYQDIRDAFEPVVFAPVAQHPNPASFQILLIRSSAPDLAAGVKATMAAINPEIRFSTDSLTSMVMRLLLKERLMASLSSLFGVLAIVLATVGLYGVVSYMVLQRTREIGIRMALGAMRPCIVLMILKDAALLLGSGLALGILLAFFAVKAADKLLFGLPPRDLPSFAGAAMILALTAAVASYIPARRASRLDPMDALREE